MAIELKTNRETISSGPEDVIRCMQAARDPRQEGIAVYAELLQQAKDLQGISGGHLMAPGMHQEVVEAVKLAGMAL